MQDYLKTKRSKRTAFHIGLEPTVANYSIWNLRATDILIHFNEAQVAPRIYGILEVAVPYQILKGVPLAPLLMPCAVESKNCVAR